MIALSHFGINVTDVDRMADFYTRVLGLLVSDRGPLENGPTLVFLSRNPDEHHRLVLVSGRPPGGGDYVVNRISVKVATLEELQAMYRRAQAHKIFEDTEAICRSRLGFIAREDWRRIQVDRIAVVN